MKVLENGQPSARNDWKGTDRQTTNTNTKNEQICCQEQQTTTRLIFNKVTLRFEIFVSFVKDESAKFSEITGAKKMNFILFRTTQLEFNANKSPQRHLTFLDQSVLFGLIFGKTIPRRGGDVPRWRKCVALGETFLLYSETVSLKTPH